MRNEFNFRNPSVNVHKFAMIPRADIPRSSFRMQTTHKTTLDASYLYPVFLQEVLPGDSFAVHMTAFSRMATPVFPIMDNMVLTSFFFFVPNRIVWANWVKFMGEQDNPSDSISFTIPTLQSPAGGFPNGSLADYFGLPCVGQTVGTNTITVSALPFRAYNLIWHQWFRDENLQNGSWTVGGPTPPVITNVPSNGDGPDQWAMYLVNGAQDDPNHPGLFPRGKRHDYFTSCLPWTEKGGVSVSIPLGGQAVVKTSVTDFISNPATPMHVNAATNLGSGASGALGYGGSLTAGPADVYATSTAVTLGSNPVAPTNLYADLSTATAATINALRLAFQTQKLLERDARGGTRYTEIIRSHFGVMSPDMRLQRAEYLGGGQSPINITPVAQTSATGVTGGSTPVGTLGAIGTNLTKGHGFRQSFTEHGHIIGLVAITGDLSYHQGIRRLWSRSTRYDFYFPVFATLGEQAVLNQEIYSVGNAGSGDFLVFGYQERWAEYRYFPSMITGMFKSYVTDTLDAWHLSQAFGSLPALNGAFIIDPLQSVLPRNLAAGDGANGEQFICDFFFDMKAARPMPMYSVPGLIDHF